MYVSIPKNYRGVAFSKDGDVKKEVQKQSLPQTLPILPPEREKTAFEQKESVCSGCDKNEKNPLACFLEAFRGRKRSGFDTEDFLLLGLIALLLNKEGNDDIVFILAMLLLM